MLPTHLPFDLESLWTAWLTPDFNHVLAAQLRAHWQQIPLEKACENGGRPDNPHFHNFRSTESEPAALSISFEVSFRETAVAGCGSAPDEQTRFAEFALEITRRECVIEYRPRRHEPEF